MILRSRTCLLWVFGAVRVAHPCCDFRIKTIFSSSLPPAVCRKTRVLFTLFVLAASSWSCSSFCEFPIPQLSHSLQAYSKSGQIYTRYSLYKLVRLRRYFNLRRIFKCLDTLLWISSTWVFHFASLFVFVYVQWCPTYIAFLRFLYPMLPVSLDFPFLIALAVFSKVYL